LALLFFDKAELRAMARAATETAEDFGGASTRTMQLYDRRRDEVRSTRWSGFRFEAIARLS